MRREGLKVVRGSGYVFRDLGRPDADAAQFKAILTAEIIKVLDRKRLSVRAAHARTGIAAAGLLAHPQRRPRALYGGPADVGTQSIGRARGSDGPSKASSLIRVCCPLKRLRRAPSMPHVAGIDRSAAKSLRV